MAARLPRCRNSLGRQHSTLGQGLGMQQDGLRERIHRGFLKTVVDGEMWTKVARISTTYDSWFVHPKSTAPQLSSLPGKPRRIWLFACPDISQLRFLGALYF